MIKINSISNKISLFLLLLLVLVSPSYSLADSSPVLNPVSTVLLRCTLPGATCGFNDFIDLINGIVKFGVQLIAVIFVIILIYTGFLYLTSGGDVGKVKKAKDMITKVMWGTIYTLCGWIIVYFILTTLKVDPSFYENVISK